MPEYREVYRRDGTSTGEMVEKHAMKRPGDYFRHALIVIKTADSPLPGQGEGRYIVQQRSLKARFYAGKWDVTGGGVLAGETPEEAIIREVKEELNLELCPEQLTLAYEFIAEWDDGTGLLLSMYACRLPVPENGFTWNKWEVNNVQVMPFHIFRQHLMDHNDEAFGAALDRIEESL